MLHPFFDLMKYFSFIALGGKPKKNSVKTWWSSSALKNSLDSWKLPTTHLHTPENEQQVCPWKWGEENPKKETRIALKNHHFSGAFAVRFEGVVFFVLKCSSLLASISWSTTMSKGVGWLLSRTDVHTHIIHIREMKRKTGWCNLTRMKNLDGSYWWYFVSW